MAVAKPVTQKVVKVEDKFKSVYGVMIHPYTGTEFSTDSATVANIDSWIKSQIEAGKMVKV